MSCLQASSTTTFKLVVGLQHSACQAIWWRRCTGGSCMGSCPADSSLASWWCSSGEQYADTVHANCDAMTHVLGGRPPDNLPCPHLATSQYYRTNDLGHAKDEWEKAGDTAQQGTAEDAIAEAAPAVSQQYAFCSTSTCNFACLWSSTRLATSHGHTSSSKTCLKKGARLRAGSAWCWGCSGDACRVAASCCWRCSRGMKRMRHTHANGPTCTLRCRCCTAAHAAV